MLSRKYYVKFARILGKRDAKQNVIDDMKKFFSEDNPKFEPQQFENAIMLARLNKKKLEDAFSGV